MAKTERHKLLRQKAMSAPLCYKLTIAIVSMLFFSRDEEMIQFGDEHSDLKIMCVGESFTWGGKGTRVAAYPSQLSQVLAERYPNKGFSVVNYVVCETNSRFVRDKLPQWIDEFKPTNIVLLVGSTNRFNAWNFNSFLKGETDLDESWLKAWPMSFHI